VFLQTNEELVCCEYK